MLETLKFCGEVDTLQNCALVSRLWSSASDCEELWSDIADRDSAWKQLRAPQERSKALCRRLQARNTLTLVNRRGVHTFNCESHQWATQPLTNYEKRLDCGALAYFLDSSIICCGGADRASAHSSLYISPVSSRLPNMTHPRVWHSIVVLKGAAYVFGGNNGNKLLADAELLRRSVEPQWEALPPMTVARAAFNASEYRGRIYLCGGYTDHCEYYDPVALVYMQLPFVLPQNNSQTGLIFTNGQAIIYMKSHLIIWNPESAETRSQEMPEERMYLAGSQRPVAKQGWVYWLHGKTVQRLSVLTGVIHTLQELT